MKVLIRTDASIQIGSGHVMRCLTLAEAIKKSGGQVCFLSKDLEGNLVQKITSSGFSSIVLPNTRLPDIDSDLDHSFWLNGSQKIDAELSMKLTDGQYYDWIVVDHYALDYRWQSIMKSKSKKIMVIDDIADRKHIADLLLDQNLYSNQSRYKSLIPENTETLLGPKYALLRDEFLSAHQNARVRKNGIKRIFVFYGGADPTGETLVALDALERIDTQNMQIDVVAGSNNPSRQAIEKKCRSLGFHFHFNTLNMSGLMEKADLALGAGGTTTWERCAMGLPAFVTVIAKNQEEMSLEGHKVGFQFVLGKAGQVDSILIAEKIMEYSQSPTILNAMSEKALATVDARGTERVINCMKLKLRDVLP